MPNRCLQVVYPLILTHHPRDKEVPMRARTSKVQRQRRFRWNQECLWESIPDRRREECRRLMARLLNQVAATELGKVQKPQDERDGQER